jgi:hypothetical protein
VATGCELYPPGGQAALTGLLHGSVGWFHGGVSAPPTHEPPVTCRVVRGSGVASTFAQALEAIAPALRGRAVVLTRLSPPTPVSAAVIEELVDLLFEGGCGDVLVAAALSIGDRDRGHRSVQALAHTAGLTGRSHRGRLYEVVDLGASTAPASVPDTSVLSGRSVSSAWADADVRVVLARSVTSLADAYDGCLATLLAAVPEVVGADPADVATDLLVHLPPALAVIDATVTSHGADGRHTVRELTTESLIVANDTLLADSTLATLLGQDRAGSRLVERALRVLGEPLGRVVGDLTPFTGVTRPHPLLVHAFRRAGAERSVARVLSAAVGGPDKGAGAGDPVLAGIRRVLTPLVAAADEPAQHAALLGLLTAVAGVVDQTHGWSVPLAKDRVSQVEVPLGFDPGSFAADEYDSLPDFFAPFERLLEQLPNTSATESGVGSEAMRWRMLDGAVVFETSRVIAADFGQFVARVDVAAGISLMADYLGGRRVTVSVDDQGRVVRQAERNLYLPQPNYLAIWGGEPIDVCKIELVERADTEQRLLWRTIDSLNGSARWDDGSLTFTDLGTDGTRVTVRGRQLFALPPAWSGIDLDLVPELKTPLVEDAYRRFFTATFDNLEACFEGRPFRIGRPAPTGDEPLATESLHQFLGIAQSWLDERSADRTSLFGEPKREEPDEVDLHGFSHFGGAR